MKWRWPWHRNEHEAKQIREHAERERDATQRATPRVERMAEAVAKVPPEEFVERVARAFGMRPL